MKTHNCPKTGFISKEIIGDEIRIIEYDIDRIRKILNNENPMTNFKDFPKINEEQLHQMLSIVSVNVVSVEIKPIK